MDLTLSSSEFFHERIQAVKSQLKNDISEASQWYVTGILDDFTKQPVMRQALGIQILDLPSEPALQIAQLKQAGDTAMFVAGFFPESLKRSTVSPRYYIDMGRMAYDRLAALFRPKRLWEVFGELAENLPLLVKLIQLVKRQLLAPTLGLGLIPCR